MIIYEIFASPTLLTAGGEYFDAAYVPPSAGFTASKSETLVGDSIQFTEQCTGGLPPLIYLWDFGDGSTSTEENPAHAYAAAGTYTVSMKATDAAKNSTTSTKTVTVFPAPMADFAADKTGTLLGQPIVFTSMVTGGKAPYTYQWSFGDGQSSTEANPTHIYANAGTFTVSVIITDALGNHAEQAKDNYVSVYEALSVDFTASKTTATVNEAILFTPAVSGGKAPYTYEWAFGDGGTSTAASPPHAYTAADTYTVTLKVTDQLGDQVVRTKPNFIAITAAAPTPTPRPTPPTPLPKTEPIVLPEKPAVIATEDGRITVAFPAGAVGQETKVVIRQIPITEAPPPVSGFRAGATFFSIEGVGVLSKPINITVRYSDADIAAAGGYLKLLTLSRYDKDKGEWVILPTTVDVENRTLTALTDRTSIWATMVKETPAPPATPTVTPIPTATPTAPPQPTPVSPPAPSVLVISAPPVTAPSPSVVVVTPTPTPAPQPSPTLPPSPSLPAVTQTPTPTMPAGSPLAGGIPVWVWAVIGLSVVAVVVILLVPRRRFK